MIGSSSVLAGLLFFVCRQGSKRCSPSHTLVMGDENGSLLALYHGSKNKFNEFTSDINWFSSSKEYSNNYGKEANLFNKVTKTEPKKSKVTFETHLNIKILIWPKMNLFLLKLNRRRLNPKAVLSTSVKLYAKGARLQGCFP